MRRQEQVEVQQAVHFHRLADAVLPHSLPYSVTNAYKQRSQYAFLVNYLPFVILLSLTPYHLCLCQLHLCIVCRPIHPYYHSIYLDHDDDDDTVHLYRVMHVYSASAVLLS